MHGVAAFAALMLLAVPAAAEEAGPAVHVHGTSVLNITVEGTDLTLELTAPAADIMGFEEPATSYAQHVAVTKAQRSLLSPLALFALPPAGCGLASSEVGQIFPAPGDRPAGTESHSDFRATYHLTCSDPREIKSIDFRYFRVFPSARTVIVNLGGDRAKASFRVERSEPHLDLGGTD